MIPQDILRELEIDDAESFRYFEQFAALMETSVEVDYDTFAEVLRMADPEALTEMVRSFFEDIIRGVPDDNMALYSALEARREVLETLSRHMEDRGAGFFIDELYNFREWFREPETVLCVPEDRRGSRQRLSPCEAMMLYREEKLSGVGYQYDFSEAVLGEIDEYVLSMLEELGEFPAEAGDDWDDRGLDELPEELPADFDPSSYIPGETDLSELTGRLDPYRDGLIDRNNPVIDGIDYES